MQPKIHTIPFAILLFCCAIVLADKKASQKYSRKANEPLKLEEYHADIRNLQRPFRMAKLNLVWSKAQNRLTEPKLKSLYVDLKIHDKEELAWKQLASQSKDKDGIMENELRLKLIGIMSTYDLLEHFDDTQNKEKVKPYKKLHDSQEQYKNKSLFKDKKLNSLWAKAEISGFNQEELEQLREEFQHHQDKVDVYYSLLDHVGKDRGKRHENAIDEDEMESFNLVNSDPNDNEVQTPQMMRQKYESEINTLRDHHRGIKDHYDRLERVVSSGPNSQDFIEPKVQGLWRVAMSSNFSDKELSSIKSELHHFESRLLKLRHLHTEHAMHQERYKDGKLHGKTELFDEMEDKIKKQTHKVQKLQDTIEQTIFKHSEL